MQIKDSRSDAVVADVTVATTSTPAGQRALTSKTDSKGQVLWKNVSTGSYDLRLSKTGYYANGGRVTVADGTTATATVYVSRVRLFIIVSGGPGLFDTLDREHDQNWSNFVDTVLLQAAQSKFPEKKDEEVWWLIYKPAYEARWNDDVKQKKGDFRLAHVERVRKQKFSSYVDLMEHRASKYGWKLQWMSKSQDFWEALNAAKDPINRVWYFGHARGDLWLVITHTSGHAAALLGPQQDTTIKASDISDPQRIHFLEGKSTNDPNTMHRFFGCNTNTFAQTWSSKFGVWSEGYENTLSFEHTYTREDHFPEPGTACVKRTFKPDGSLAP